jgi:hypothetical protein
MIRPALTGDTWIEAAIAGRIGETTQLSAMTTKPAKPRIKMRRLSFISDPPDLVTYVLGALEGASTNNGEFLPTPAASLLCHQIGGTVGTILLRQHWDCVSLLYFDSLSSDFTVFVPFLVEGQQPHPHLSCSFSLILVTSFLPWRFLLFLTLFQAFVDSGQLPLQLISVVFQPFRFLF